MKALIISIDKESSLKKLMELAKKLRLKAKVVETKSDANEHDEWMQLSAQIFANAYSDNEPDISHLSLREPNPKYNPR